MGCLRVRAACSMPHGIALRKATADKQNAPRGGVCLSGGEGGIRTHGTLTRTPDFESGTFDHSATSPKGSRVDASRRFYVEPGVLTSAPGVSGDLNRPSSWPAAARCRPPCLG